MADEPVPSEPAFGFILVDEVDVPIPPEAEAERPTEAMARFLEIIRASQPEVEVLGCGEMPECGHWCINQCLSAGCMRRRQEHLDVCQACASVAAADRENAPKLVFRGEPDTGQISIIRTIDTDDGVDR